MSVSTLHKGDDDDDDDDNNNNNNNNNNNTISQCCLFSDPYKTHKYTVWVERRIFKFSTWCYAK